jgi:hypothetical protein
MDILLAGKSALPCFKQEQTTVFYVQRVSAACGKHSAEGERHSGVHRKSVRLRYRNSVRLAGGIVFTFPPEYRSASFRNRVRM